MISYDPLFETLESKSVKLIRLQNDLELSSSTTAKFRKGGSVTLETVGRICVYLDVPIERVVRIDTGIR